MLIYRLKGLKKEGKITSEYSLLVEEAEVGIIWHC